MAYFNYFPTIGYDVRGVKNQTRIDAITNVLVRVRKKMMMTNASLFEHVFVSDGDKPEILAHKYYDDSTLHWIILYTNYMTNPLYDWPLTYFDLQKYVASKYSDINGIHHYEDNDGFEVDSDAANATPITNFLYEEKRNDNNRNINIIRKEYVNQIIQEFKSLI
jgi:hypothetical protein